MHVSSIAGQTAFRATVEGRSPLVNGNWAHISLNNQPQSTQQAEPKKGSFWKKAFWTVVTLGVAAGLLAYGRGTKPISEVMGKTFKNAGGIKEKALWILGKGGDYVKAGWNKTGAKAVDFCKNLFKSKKTEDAAVNIHEGLKGKTGRTKKAVDEIITGSKKPRTVGDIMGLSKKPKSAVKGGKKATTSSVSASPKSKSAAKGSKKVK